MRPNGGNAHDQTFVSILSKTLVDGSHKTAPSPPLSELNKLSHFSLTSQAHLRLVFDLLAGAQSGMTQGVGNALKDSLKGNHIWMVYSGHSLIPC